MHHKENKFRYIDSFDWLRGVGCLFILIGHGSYDFFKGGWIALDLFFVMSGYLITTLLLKEFLITGNISFTKFYTRRALKLFPALIICIILANILWPFTKLNPGSNEILATSGALFYFSNFLQAKIAGNMIHLWSLSVEEHFYFFWPLVMLYYILKKPFKKTVLVLLIVVLLASVFRVFIFNYHISGELFTLDPYRCTFARVDSIIMGALLAIVIQQKLLDLSPKFTSKISTILRVVFWVFIVILFTVSEENSIWNNGGFIITNLLCTFTIFITLKYPDHRFFRNKILKWVGKRSYSIYLYHIPIFYALERFKQPHDIPNFLLLSCLRLAASVAVAILSYKYIEQPILRFKKRYEVYKIQHKGFKVGNQELLIN